MNGHSPPGQTGAQRLRSLLSDRKKTIVAPGVYDGITARLALASGAECLYMTGAGTSMSRLGMADLGLADFSIMLSTASMLSGLCAASSSSSSSIPLIADADTGYGGPINVAQTVRAYARAGVAGLHIEDQVQEKRCGHLSGKVLVGRETYFARLRAACRARDAPGYPGGGGGEDGRIVVIARTDARAGQDSEGNGGWEEAVARLQEAERIGVDALFFEALHSEAEMTAALSLFPNTPMLLNMVPGGRTPVLSNQRAEEMGFRIVIWPTIGLEAVVPRLRRAYEGLRRDGRPPEEEEGKEAMGPGKLFEVCGSEELMEFDASVGGKAYAG